jgi:acyl-homoserine-lactone acylase
MRIRSAGTDRRSSVATRPTPAAHLILGAPGGRRRRWAVAIAAVVACQASTVCGKGFESRPVLPGHQVQIIRDAYGMAHLYADHEEDGFYGLGYAEGEDRLQQILTWYVALRGELAATFGPTTPPLHIADPVPWWEPSALSDAVANDLSARKYRILESARRNFSRLPPQYRRDIRAFIAGMSAYMHEHPDKTPSWAPPLEPALPIGVFHLFALEAQSVCDERRAADAAQGQNVALAATDAPHTALGSSNVWAVAGSRSADGGVFLESDSHDPLQIYGMLFYPYHIKAGDLDFMAFETAGSAQFLFGHSPYFAWGITEGPRFVADCYRVSVDHNAPRRFLFDGKPRHMTVVPYAIRVKGGRPVRGVFEYTHHNGVASPLPTW